jgi:Winged helix DNA-binding domain
MDMHRSRWSETSGDQVDQGYRGWIARQRLWNQQITQTRLARPQDVIAWLGAAQAQDYAGAKWSIGLRLPATVDAEIERACDAGEILRTHALRPTWHFLAPADIRWVLALTAPRVHAINATYYRKLGLDQATLAQSAAAIVAALEGGRQLTRDELRQALQRVGIVADSTLRMGLLVMYAELEGLICSGARRGRQFTYALLDERAPSVRPLERDLALAELARRFFLSRGPASVHDFSRWSGLTLSDARGGLEAVKGQLLHEEFDGQSYWMPEPAPTSADPAPVAHLLSIYDEYVSGYKDRSAIVSAAHGERLVAMDNDLTAIVVLDGQIVGTWKRTLKKSAVVIEASLFVTPSDAQAHAIGQAAERLGAFLELPATLHTR